MRFDTIDTVVNTVAQKWLEEKEDPTHTEVTEVEETAKNVDKNNGKHYKPIELLLNHKMTGRKNVLLKKITSLLWWGQCLTWEIENNCRVGIWEHELRSVLSSVNGIVCKMERSPSSFKNELIVYKLERSQSSF